MRRGKKGSTPATRPHAFDKGLRSAGALRSVPPTPDSRAISNLNIIPVPRESSTIHQVIEVSPSSPAMRDYMLVYFYESLMGVGTAPQASTRTLAANQFAVLEYHSGVIVILHLCLEFITSLAYSTAHGDAVCQQPAIDLVSLRESFDLASGFPGAWGVMFPNAPRWRGFQADLDSRCNSIGMYVKQIFCYLGTLVCLGPKPATDIKKFATARLTAIGVLLRTRTTLTSVPPVDQDYWNQAYSQVIANSMDRVVSTFEAVMIANHDTPETALCTYLRELIYNQENIGYRILKALFIDGCPQVLFILEIADEVMVLQEFQEGVRSFEQKGNDMRWYSISKPKDLMSYTRLLRLVPVLSSAARVIMESKKGTDDSMCEGFGKLDNRIVGKIVSFVKNQYSRSKDIDKLIGKNLAAEIRKAWVHASQRNSRNDDEDSSSSSSSGSSSS